MQKWNIEKVQITRQKSGNCPSSVSNLPTTIRGTSNMQSAPCSVTAFFILKQ